MMSAMHNSGLESIPITINGLQCWHDSKNILQFSFEAGQTYVIIGRNGAGKTTLLEMIAGITTPYAGHIFIGDQLLRQKKWYGYRWNSTAIGRLSVSLQHAETGWLGSTIQEECELVLHAHWGKNRKKDAEKGSAEVMRLDERVKKYLTLFGLDHIPLETEIQQLSVGQQKRLSIATAMMCELPWLLLDEPAAGLDHEAIGYLRNAIEQYKASGGGVIMVSHQLQSLEPIIDHVVELNEYGLVLKDVEQWQKQAIAPDEHRYAQLMQASVPYDMTVHSAAITAGNNEGGTKAKTKSKPEPITKSVLLSQYFDPRFILLTILLSLTTILVWNNWLTVTIYSFLSLIGIITYRHKWRQWRTMIISFIVISLIFALVGGLQWKPIQYDLEKGLQILLRMSQFLVIIAISLPVMELMTPFRLQRSLEQSFSWLEKLRIPVYSYTLLISLIFRMIPLLVQQWEQMSKLARVRMKLRSWLSVNALSKLLIAYVRAILIVADRLATSLELRGFQIASSKQARGLQMVIRRQDYVLLSIAIAITIAVTVIQV